MNKQEKNEAHINNPVECVCGYYCNVDIVIITIKHIINI